MRPVLLALALASATTPAVADDACSTFKWPIAREKAAFAAPGLPMVSSGGPMSTGGAARLTLLPQGSVVYAVKPAKAPRQSPAFGAEVTLAAPPATVLQVTLSDDAWVDVVQNGRTLRSTGFSGKTGCPGIRKSVRFTLVPGPAVIAISDAPKATLDVAVLPAD